MKRIDSGYKLIGVLSGGRGSADTVVNVATVEFRFGAVILIEKSVFNEAYEKISSQYCSTLIDSQHYKRHKDITTHFTLTTTQ